MRAFLKPVAVACALVLMGLGCKSAKPAPLKPRKPLAAGAVMFQFTRSVRGDIDLSIDDVRIPVTRDKKAAKDLLITGLPAGKHRYFLSGSKEAFGPSQGEFEVSTDKGVFIVTFIQRINSVLYGQANAMPPAEGMPGVKAVLEH